jgi:hypothetical protein
LCVFVCSCVFVVNFLFACFCFCLLPIFAFDEVSFSLK